MVILFEIIKIVFFLSSISMGLFWLRGYYYLPDKTYIALGNIFLPAYLVLTGLMIGYIILVFYKAKLGDNLQPSLQVKGFIGGLIIGVLLALLYIFIL